MPAHTWGFVQAGLDGILFGFLLLTSTLYFQSALVVVPAL